MANIERCAKALMASYWGWSAEETEAEWPELGDADQERARHAARACLQASGAVSLIEQARYCVTAALNCSAHPWHGSDEARKWLIEAARLGGQ